MAVSVQSVNNLSPSATADTADAGDSVFGAQLVDMRSGGHPPAGSYNYEGDELVTTWHAHDLHQVEYAFHGTVEVETASAHYLLPPQQAAWIPAGVEHRSTIRTSVRTVSVFFETQLVPSPGDRVRILAVPPVLREMLVYAGRWPIERATSDAMADSYFVALGQLVSDGLDDEAPLCLPTSQDPVLTVALAWTRDHLRTATFGGAARHAGLSERSLRRRFETGLGMSWRDYVLQARLLRAMAQLAEPVPSVLDVSLSVGFDSVSSFNRAFRARTGETPSAYRRQRVRPR
jgi:AraC-like DNA-binding protein/mannose-6-phosphate isomerase-like protein (cupin superfamily)